MPLELEDEILNAEQYTILFGRWPTQKISNAMTLLFLKEVIGFNVTFSFEQVPDAAELELQAKVNTFQIYRSRIFLES